MALPRSTPAEQGVDVRGIDDFVAAVGQLDEAELHSLMVLRHGHVVAEAWWHPYRPDTAHLLYSLSKSFTSTALGMAVAAGRARRAIDAPVARVHRLSPPSREAVGTGAVGTGAAGPDRPGRREVRASVRRSPTGKRRIHPERSRHGGLASLGRDSRRAARARRERARTDRQAGRPGVVDGYRPCLHRPSPGRDLAPVDLIFAETPHRLILQLHGGRLAQLRMSALPHLSA